MSDENEELKAMKCKACGGDIVKSYRTDEDDEDEEIPVAKCLSCGQEYDQYSQEYYEYFSDDFTTDVDSSIFELGLKGVLEDVEYEIIGRIRFQDEDDYDVSTWDEWFAVSSDGVYHYFIEEDGEIYSYEEYVPESIDLESNDEYIEFEGKNISKDEGYIGRIVYAEGELSWKPEIGEPVTCYEFKKDGFKFSIEQSEDEVSITRGENISHKEIIDAFRGEEYKEQYEKTMKKRKSYGLKSIIYLIAFLLTLGATIYNCSSGVPVEGVMNSKKIITDNKLMIEKQSRSHFSQVLYGPFDISKGDTLYDINVSINERIHRLHLEWQSFRLMLLKEERLNRVTNSKLDLASLKNLFNEIDAQKEPVESYMVTGDFWDEQGVDSEGYGWHENDLSASADFVLDDAGKYYIYLELYSKNIRKVDSVVLSIVSSKSVMYLIIIMVVLIILMFINRSKSKSYNELPFDVASE